MLKTLKAYKRFHIFTGEMRFYVQPVLVFEKSSIIDLNSFSFATLTLYGLPVVFDNFQILICIFTY